MLLVQLNSDLDLIRYGKTFGKLREYCQIVLRIILLFFVCQGIISKRLDLGNYILHGNWTITAAYGHQVFSSVLYSSFLTWQLRKHSGSAKSAKSISTRGDN